jgi:hypothetical protein
MKAIMWRGKNMGKGYTLGLMGLNMKGNGKIISWMALYISILLKYKGIYCWADGRRYEGGWKDSNMHGKG